MGVCQWLYARHTDKFVVTHDGENNEIGVFVRTRNGGWFGIGSWFNSSLLDSSGKVWESLVENIDNFDYTDEEKKQIIEENSIS